MPQSRVDDKAVPVDSSFEKEDTSNYEEAPYAQRNPSQASRRKSVSAKLRNPLAGLSK
jgi:hypothetical protein